MATSEDHLSLAYATEEEAEFVGVAPSAPLLLMRSVMYDDGRPVEYLKSVNHPDRVTFRITGRL